MSAKLTFVFLLPLAAAAALSACDKKSGGDPAGGSSSIPVIAGQLFPDNFKGVCSGATVAAATPYSAAAPAHKALLFGTYKDDLTDNSSSLPPDWTVLFSPTSDALKAIDLVACAKRTAAKEVKLCSDYKDDGKPSQNKVRWHTATYELSVREAATGKILAQKTIEATDASCPMFYMFGSKDEVADGFASLSDSAVTDFLKPFVKP